MRVFRCQIFLYTSGFKFPHCRTQFAARWRGWHRLIVDDVITFLQFASEAFLWLGAWNLNVRFLIQDHLVGGWTNHIIGAVLLMSFQLFSYVGSCGCTTDGESKLNSVPSGKFIVSVIL